MARRRDSMPPPPGDGGYEFEVIELGPPTYFSPPPTVKARGKLIPVGDQPRPTEDVGTTADPSPPPIES